MHNTPKTESAEPDESDTLEMNPEQVREILRRGLDDKRALRKTQQNAD